MSLCICLISADQAGLTGHWTMACVEGWTRLGLDEWEVLSLLLGEVRPLDCTLWPTVFSPQCTP